MCLLGWSQLKYRSSKVHNCCFVLVLSLIVTRLGCFYVTAIYSWGYGWGWVEVDIDAKVDLNLRLKWGWDEIEMRLSRSLVEIELRLIWSWDKLTLNKGRNWAFIGVGLWFKICFRSTYVAEQYMFSMLLSTSSN